MGNSLPGLGTMTSVRFSEENQKSRIQRTATKYDKHLLPHDERNVKQHSFTSLHFNQVPQFLPHNIPVTSDVFQLARFKTSAKNDKPFSSSHFNAFHTPAEAYDVFLEAPSRKRQGSTKAVSTYSHIFTSGPKLMHPSKQCHLLPVSSLPAPQPPSIQAPALFPETVQQPMAVHRVVTRVGQQVAVGSVAVGPLHSWSTVARALDDPFTAAPFQPRFSQGKP